MREQILFGQFLARMAMPMSFDDQVAITTDVRTLMKVEAGLAQMHASLPPEIVAEQLTHNRLVWMSQGPPAHVGGR